MTATPVRILVITGVFPPMAIAESDHIARLSEGLAARGYDIHVLTGRDVDAGAVKGCRVHAEMTDWSWRSQAKLERFAREMKPDLVFIWFIGSAFGMHPMISLLPARLKATMPDVKIVTQITAPVGVRPKNHPFLTRAFRKLSALAIGGGNISYEYGVLLRDSDRVVAMAESHLQRYSLQMPGLESKSAIIPPPPLILMSEPGEASRAKGREMLGVPADVPLFAYFGRIYEGKGLEYLIRAFRTVRDQLPSARLAIIGGATPDWFKSGWRPEELTDLAKQAGVHDAISWTGEFPFDTDAGSLYLRAADYAVLPFDEGAALNNSSIAACMAHGLPVITTRGERPELAFNDAGNVLLCTPKDTEALAGAMLRLHRDAALSAQLRLGSDDLTVRLFSWQATLDRTVAVFDDVLGLPPARAPA
jgi:glycosyltransferase involved in cell wall biosynthesis